MTHHRRLHAVKPLTIGAAVLVLLVLLAVRFAPALAHGWQALLDALAALGPLAPLAFIAVYALTCVLLLPGGPLTPAAGALFGVPLGLACVSAGTVIGATCAFLLSRRFGRAWVLRHLKPTRELEYLDAAVKSEGWKLVALIRLCPLIPFRISNYVLGTTGISLPAFAAATWLGCLPTALFYVLLGYTARRAGESSTAEISRVALPFALFGLVALGVLVWFLTRLARRALTAARGSR